MAKYLKRKKPNWFARIMIAFLAAVILLICLVVGYIWIKLDRISYADEVHQGYETLAADQIQVNDPEDGLDYADEDYVVSLDGFSELETAPVISDQEISSDEQVTNILLIGTDERTTAYHVNARADSMILVSIHRGNKTVRLVSLERGIGVPILEGDLAGQYDLLTHVFRWGGADLLVKTVEHCFKVDVNHYVRLNFASVEKIVDVIGGIEIELNEEEVDYLGKFAESNSSTGSQKPLKTGLNHLDGGNALAYARLRAIDSDWQRVGRQRKVILAVVDALKESSLLELNELADTVLPLIQTNLTKLEIAELILYAPNFLTSEFDQMTIPKQGTYGGMKIRNGAGAFAVDFELNNDLLHRFLYEGASSAQLLAE